MLSTSLSALGIVGICGLVYLAITKTLRARRIFNFHNELD